MAEIAVAPSRSRLLRRSNSTASLFIKDTVTKPKVNDLLSSVATMLHCQLTKDEGSKPTDANDPFYFFREDTYVKKKTDKLPTPEEMFAFLHGMMRVGEFPLECSIIALVYINRLIGLTRRPLTVATWKPVLTVAIMVSQKVWDDNPLANLDFCVLYPVLSCRQLNALEARFLALIQYKLIVTASLFARYTFELFSIAEVTKVDRLSVKRAEELDIRGGTQYGPPKPTKRELALLPKPKQVSADDASSKRVSNRRFVVWF